MNFLDNITIKSKLIFICSITVIGMLSLLIIEMMFTKQLDRLGEAQITIEKMNSGMLTLRRNEKDFLARNDEKYIGKFNDNYDKLIEDVNKLDELVSDIGLDKNKELAELEAVFSNYHSTFLSIGELKREIGLTPKTGLYGALRNSVHNAEKSIKDLGDWQLLSETLMLRRREKDFMLRFDEKYLDKFDTDFAQIEDTLNSRTYSSDITQSVGLNLNAYANDFRKLSAKMKELGLTPKTGLHGELRSTIHESETALSNLSDTFNTFLVQSKSSSQTFLYTSRIIVSLIIVVVLALVYNAINSPLQRLKLSLRTINQNRDLTIRSNISGRNEIAELSEYFDGMLESFMRVLYKIQHAADETSGASKSLTKTSHDNSSSLREQQQLIELVATAMTQMAASISEVAQNIANTSESAQDAYSQTISSKETVDKAARVVASLEQTTTNTKNVLDELKHDCLEVGAVMSVIRGIAEQTNLLALNAAIEAARAGEQGRGFAVVADEVRTLAGKTQESTEEIDNIVHKLQSNAENAVDAMEESIAQVHETVEQANSANLSLDKVITMVDLINNMSSQIAAAAEQQSAVAEDMNKQIVGIKDHADTNTENAELTLASSEKQAQLAHELNDLVNQFKVS